MSISSVKSKAGTAKVKRYQDDDGDQYLLRYYSDNRCKCCLELDSREMWAQPDDDLFLSPYDDFEGDELLKFHVIHYRRKIWQSGRWDIDCPPRYGCGIGGQLHPGKHLYANEDHMKTDKLLNDIAKHVVDTYNKEKGGKLILCEILNVTEEGCHWRNFYLTFNCRDDSHEGKGKRIKSRSSVKTYRAAVACCVWSLDKKKEILVFTDCATNADLLPADPRYKELTTPFRDIEPDPDEEECGEEVVAGDSKT